MFNTKLEVDRHVEKCMRNLNSDVERNLRGLAFAKMYYKVREYEQALRYVIVYLNTKPTSAEGQNLHGKILEHLGRTTQALEAYRLSLDLDSKQNNLVLKICELMAREQNHFDSSSARYYCEKAQSIDPNNPVIFHLKERLVAAASKDPNDVTNLLLKELESRPLDVDVRVRLLRHLVQHNRSREAYTHAYDIEQKHSSIFLNHLKWCEAVVEVLGIYRSTNNVLTWEFWMMYVSALDRLVALNFNDRTKDMEHAPLVLNFDQVLQLAGDELAACPQKQLVQEFWTHYAGQLCWHFLTLLYKQARKALIKYREAGQMGVPLIFAAYCFKPADLQALWLEHATTGSRAQMQRWHREAAYRCAQAGHMLASLAHERKTTLLERGTHGVTGQWREKTFKFLFISREQQNKAITSFFMLSNQLLDIPIRLPEHDDLVAFTKTAQLLHPNSLHHHIWLGLNSHLADFECAVFPGLQYTVKTFTNCAAETLSILDIQAFIFAATLCAQSQHEEQKHSIYYNAERPKVLPIPCSDLLGTAQQEKWLQCAYKLFTNQPNVDVTEMRMTLIRGIETIRCVGNHGMDARLLVQLARRFAERATKVTKHSEVEANEARAEMYWRSAMYLLEKHKRNEHVSHISSRLFEYKGKDLTLDQVHQAINDGKLFLGRQAMKKKDFETAINAFKNIKDPYASFYQAQIYKMMADKETNLKSENVTSEMRSQNIILLTKARDCLYLTLDRLRMPGSDPKHPLYEVLHPEIEKNDRLLARIDPDNNRNECDGMSDDNVSSIESDFNCTLSRLETSVHHGVHSTPFRGMDNSRRDVREARPSPERLDAQIRQIAASKDITLNKVLEQNRNVIESQKCIAEELKTFRETVSELTTTINDLKALKIIAEDVKQIKQTVDDLDSLRNVSDMVYELRKEVAELKKNAASTSKAKPTQLSDEDLYGFEDVDLSAEIANTQTPLSALYAAGRMNQSVQNMGYPVSSPLYGYPLYPPYGGMPGMMPGVNFPQAHPGDAAAAHLADYRAMNSLLQGYSHHTPGMQAPLQNLPQQMGASPGYMQTPPTQQYPVQVQPTNLFGSASTQSMPSTVMPNSQSLSFGLGSMSSTATSASLSSLTIGNTGNATLTSSTSAPSVSVPSAAAPPHLAPISVPSSRPAPVNVVITSSDPLPKTTVTQQQPILSVTIPPEHLKGNKVHNYQITLPNSASSPANAPSVLSQAPLVVSTQSMLSNISAPVYSSLSDSPSKSSSSSALGLQIEKSLNNSFNRTANDSEGDVSRDDEHDPCPDFKPIIPLPDEVPVTTGEENETVLFKERAKLFRFAGTEWKERGVGDFKILQHNESKKVRVLMRRDQVHKICANHFLQPDTELNPMKNNAKAYIWPANDFSEGHSVLETFCVQFKTPEIAKSFYNCFEKVKHMKPANNSASTPTVVSIQNTSVAATPTKPGFPHNSMGTADMGGFKFSSTPTFKPKEDEVSKPLIVKPAETPKSVASPFAAFSFSSTPTAVGATATGTTPASKPFSSFTFASTTNQKQSTPTTNLFASLGNTATFTPPALAASTTPSSTPVKPANATPITKVSTPAEVKTPTQNEESDDFVPTAEFKPVIPLPELIDVKTGEEGAEILFENKAKLLRFDSNNKEWKERGVGQMKILKDSNMLRLLMRREQVHKVCCNHQVLKQMQFTKMAKSQNAITWCAKDFSEGVLTTEMLAVRFKTEELANKFLNIIQTAQADMSESNLIGGGGSADNTDAPHKKLTTAKGFGDTFKPKAGDWECKICLVTNKSKVSRCVACESPKNDAVANAKVDDSKFCFGVKPPSGQMLFGNASTTTKPATVGFGDQFKPKEGSWQCKGCYTQNEGAKVKCVCCEAAKPGTETSTPTSTTTSTLKGVDLSTGGLTFSFGLPAANTSKPAAPAESQESVSVVSSTTTISQTGFGDQFKPKAGSWECKGCYTRNNADTMYCPSCETPRDDTVPPKSTAASNTPKGIDLSTGGQKFVFGIPPKTPQDQPKTTSSLGSFTSVIGTPQTGFTFTLGSSTGEKTKEGIKDDVEEVFGSPHKVGFEFTPRSPRRQSGGQQLDEDGGDDSYYEEEEANVYFKPVIPLPDKVAVTTGEEEEEVLYCHRAKLYRHAVSEWKERGIGELKILFQKDLNKLRVLMRREQVHKICLNHVLTREIVYTKKDDKTWLFNAPDFSEGSIEHCSFCLRFKTPEVAEEFMKAINDALKRTNVDEAAIDEGSESDVEFISETHVSEEEQAEARRLLLPPKFMAYRQLEDCKCEQCLKEDAEEKGTTTPRKNLFGNLNTSIVSSGGSTSFFGTPVGNFSFGNFSSPATTTATTNSNEPPAKTETVKDLLRKPSLFGSAATPPTTTQPAYNYANVASLATGTPSTTPTVTTSTPPATTTKSSIFGAGSVFGQSPLPTGSPFSSGNFFGQVTPGKSFTGGNLFGGTAPKPAEATFSFANLTKPAEEKEKEKDTSKDAKSMFSFADMGKPKEAAGTPTAPSFSAQPILGSATSNVSFASLAANAENMPFGKPKVTATTENPFANLGAGQPVFGAKPSAPANTSKTEDDDEDGAGGDTEHDPHYDPIIPLPDEVEVKTGEEDEEVLFSERGKLYRFTNKEWKERGVGNIKVLYHPGNNSYRLLLRREAVHKIVLNQRITADLEVIAFTLSANAWMWAGMNYSEDGHVLEKLAARFKNEALSQAFYAAIQKAIAAVKETANTSTVQALPPVSNVIENVSDVEEEEEEDDEQDYEEEEDDDDDRAVMNSCECGLFEQVGSTWKTIIMQGLAEIVFDRDVDVTRIIITNDAGIILSNTLIASNSNMERKPDENGCELHWTAVEHADERLDWRTLKLTFESAEEAESFYLSYHELKAYADQANIVDEIPSRDGYEPWEYDP